MPERDYSRFTTPLLITAALVFTYGAIATLNLKSVPYDGYHLGLDEVIFEIDPGSPAALAGLRVGDELKSLGGLAVGDGASVDAVAEIGETTTIVVERTAETELGAAEVKPSLIEVQLTYAPLAGRMLAAQLVMQFVGICFLVFGLIGYVKLKDQSGLLLALVGICIGFLFIGGTHGALGGLEPLGSILFAIRISLAVFGFAFLLHFLMVFPNEKPVLERRQSWSQILIYGPAILLTLLALPVIVAPSQRTGGLTAVLNPLFVMAGLYYMAAAVFAMLHSYFVSSPHERSAYGLNLMLGAVAIAFAPAIINSLLPTVPLPGSDFYVVTLIVIPFAFTLAAIRRARVATAVAG